MQDISLTATPAALKGTVTGGKHAMSFSVIWKKVFCTTNPALCSRKANVSLLSIRESQHLLKKHLSHFMLLHGLRVSWITAMSFLNYLETFPHPHHSPLWKQPRLHSHCFKQQRHSRSQCKLPTKSRYPVSPHFPIFPMTQMWPVTY